MNIYEKRLRNLKKMIQFVQRIFGLKRIHYLIDIKSCRDGIPQRLWTLRIRLGMDEEKFAHSLGISKEEYCKYEVIGADVPDSLIVRICNIYQIDKKQFEL